MPNFSCRWEAVPVRVRRLRQTVRQLLGPEKTLARPHLRQTLQLQGAGLRQVLHTPVLPQETHEGARQVSSAVRIWVRERRLDHHQRHVHLLLSGLLLQHGPDLPRHGLRSRGLRRRSWCGRRRRWRRHRRWHRSGRALDQSQRVVCVSECRRDAHAAQ